MSSATTIYDVAKAAGVSPATVSLVLNRRQGVGAATAQRVEQAITRTKFKPRWNAAAPKAIGLIIFPHDRCLAYPWNSEVLSGASETLFNEGYTVQLIPHRQMDDSLRNIRSLANLHRIDGVLVMSFWQSYELEQMLVGDATVPQVIAGDAPASAKGGDATRNVTFDFAQAGHTAGQYLWQLGHRRFGVVVASLRDRNHRHRLDGFLSAIVEAGGDPDAVAVRECPDVNVAAGEAAAAQMMLADDRPTAVFLGNSVLASGFNRACHRLGLSIPGDVSLLGVEYGEELLPLEPAMSALQIPARRQGQEAARLLLDLICKRKVSGGRLLESNLVVRDSTANVSE